MGEGGDTTKGDEAEVSGSSGRGWTTSADRIESGELGVGEEDVTAL